MNKTNKYGGVLLLAIGEAVAMGLVVLGAFIASLFTDFVFDFTAPLGAALGAAVIICNFIFLTISVNRAVDSYLEVRGSREMTDEEAEQFTEQNSAVIQNRIKLSYIIRTVTMLAALVLAFVLKWFNPICTAIPLLMFRPIIYVSEIIQGKAKK